MISYCLNREDVLLWRVLGDRSAGFYVDVGANHPVMCSLTKWVYDQSWSGINVEPTLVFNEIESARPRDINLNIALSNCVGEATCYEHSNCLGTSTLIEELHPNLADCRDSRVTKQVPVDTLSNVLSKHASGKQIDFMSIDIEGWESSSNRSGST